MNNSILELLQGENIESDINQKFVTYNTINQQDNEEVTDITEHILYDQLNNHSIPLSGNDDMDIID